MRILHIIDTLWLGGAQTLVKGIFERKSENKNIFLFVLRKTNPAVEVNHKNVFIYPSRLKYSFAPLKELKQIIQENNIKILHCHLPRSQIFGYILKIFNFPDIKLIFHEHADIFDRGRVLPFLLKKFQNKVELFIACSKATKQKLVKRAGIIPEKIAVLYNFVDTDRFNMKAVNRKTQPERENLGIKKDDFAVGFAGRLVERKGWKEFIEAAYLLKDKPGFKFLIAGVGPDENKVRVLIKKYCIEDNITCFGYVSDMVGFYSLLDCFVLPSHWEGLPLTQLEAMAMGIPLITCDGPGMNEVPTQNIDALFTRSKDPEDLALKIKMLANDPELRKQLTNEGYNTVKRYTLNGFLNGLEKVYSCII